MGFQREGDVFSKEVIAHERGPQVIINGQFVQQRGIEHRILAEIELMGTGQVISEDGRTEDFELLRLQVSESQHSNSICVNVYYGEHEVFDKYLYEYFGL